MKTRNTFIALLTFMIVSGSYAQRNIPEVYSNLHRDARGRLYMEYQPGKKAYQVDEPSKYSLEQLIGNPSGTETGIAFDMKNQEFEGFLYYGFIHHDDGAFPYPVYFRDFEVIHLGKANIDILNGMSGKYDMIGWEDRGSGLMGYRIISMYGEILYDGKIGFKGTGPFEIATTIIEGPFLNMVGPDRVTVSFKTNISSKSSVIIDGKKFNDKRSVYDHSIDVTGLSPDTEYSYYIKGLTQLSNEFSLRTSPMPGSRTAFTFAYASDSRNGEGGGERNVRGVNAYILKKILALSLYEDARFFQFTGDLITGYSTDKKNHELQYANWKRAAEPFWHHFPIYVGMGNHEALEFSFRDTIDGRPIRMKIDRFPFETESAEAVYMENFVMPENGPESEDGSSYDPNPKRTDFPSYKESVFHYSYDNVGVIVLNSDYWYSSTAHFIRFTSGGLHGYIMDNQLKWLEETLAMFEEDPNIDHVFVTQHTPAFPNGGHVQDDMWYGGKNDWRPFVAGKPVAKGIIERRDEILDLMINKSTKVLALLTGDEHNYNKVKISDQMQRYPEMYFAEKIVLKREIWQINNGAAGAPYYAQEQTPWTEHVTGFTTQNALVLISVDGAKVTMKVLNPDTLDLIDEAILRE